jgi:MFS family permease
MAAFDNDFRLIFWIAVIPGLAAVAILILAVREPPVVTAVVKSRLPIEWSQIKRFKSAFWLTVAVGTILTLARFSEAFLILRAQSVGLTLALIPLVLIAMNVVYAATSYPIGILSDRFDRKLLLAAGFAVLILADIVLALASGIVAVMFGVGLWGLHMGMTQGLLAALIADTAPADFRGTAFGLFNGITGGALLLASLIAGLLWELIGPQATFFAGAALTTAGLFGMVLFINHRRK